jgi:hypothetical protein
MLGEADTKTAPMTDGLERLLEAEDAVLLKEGFEPVEGDLWLKGSVCYGREAALQVALYR